MNWKDHLWAAFGGLVLAAAAVLLSVSAALRG